ncbi:MAG TPA: 50S ribosomal protein L9 [Candidatus Paceibacterota bacterium]|jgi:large subunit ribosomal protein L9|nr:50S ribosomal protein L9 [Candidatus Paceibacterota bacterium]
MKVILLTDVPKVGNKHDIKDFKEGYAQNVLLAKGLAELATPQALAHLASIKAQMNKKREDEIKSFNELIASVDNKTVIIKAKANEKGHLFKAVSVHDVMEAIKESSGIEIDEHDIKVDHIKNLGNHTITIKKGNRQGKCNVIIIAQ